MGPLDRCHSLGRLGQWLLSDQLGRYLRLDLSLLWLLLDLSLPWLLLDQLGQCHSLDL